MDLNTRCPYCETVFSASLEQLQLRKGYIRCVQCAHIFDGYEAVVPSDSSPDEPPEPASEPPRPSADPRPPASVSFNIPDLDDALPPALTHAVPIPSVVRARREFTISDHQVRLPSGTEPSWQLPDDTESNAHHASRSMHPPDDEHRIEHTSEYIGDHHAEHTIGTHAG